MTAIASFAASPGDFGAAVGRVIALGDDTDTLAAMAGSLCGAFGGQRAVPAELVERLENDRLGRDHVRKLANRLADRSAPSACEKGPTPERLKLS